MKRPSSGIDCYCWSVVFLSLAQAVPVARGPNSGESQRLEAANSNYVDLNKVCLYENAVYAEGQNFTTSNPCETCICHPPAFACSLRTCDMKPGCKAIHSANKCCPEYSCECERNGKIYGNGEKVEEPNNPCKTCYCKGGEIKCSEHTCYKREDCEPIYTPGICCPKYDHCPLLEILKNKTSTPKHSLVIISDLTTQGVLDNKNTSSEETSSETPIETTPRPNSDTLTQSQSVATLEIIEIHPNMGMTPTTPVYQRPKLSTTAKIPEPTSPEEELWTESSGTDGDDLETTEKPEEPQTEVTVPFEVKDVPPLDSNDLNLARMRNQSDDNDTLSSEVVSSEEELNNGTSVDEEYERVENSTESAELPARIGEEISTEESITEENSTEGRTAEDISTEPPARIEEEPTEMTGTELPARIQEEISTEEPTTEEATTEESAETSTAEPATTSLDHEDLKNEETTTVEDFTTKIAEKESLMLETTTTADNGTTDDLVEMVTSEDLILSTSAPLIDSTTVTESSSAPLKLEEATEFENLATSTITELFTIGDEVTARYLEEITTIGYLERLEVTSTTDQPTEETTFVTGKQSGRMLSGTTEESVSSEEFENISAANDSVEVEDSAEQLTTKQPLVYSTFSNIDRITMVPPEKIQEETTESAEEFSNSSMADYDFDNATSAESTEDFSNSTNIPFKYPSDDNAAPVMVMISADQIQFLKVGEEPPLYVENPSSTSQSEESNKNNHEKVVVPKTTPITVEMIKVVNGKVENQTDEFVDFTTENYGNYHNLTEAKTDSTEDDGGTEESDEESHATTKELQEESEPTGIIEER